MIRPIHLWLMIFVLSLYLLLTVPAAAQDVSGDLLGRINTLRAGLGLPAYSLNGALASAAQNQAQWMIDNSCAIAHTRPDGSNPRSRAQAAGYGTSDVSENIYCGSLATSDNAWNFWINSGIHYAGLVNTRYKEIGIGSARGEAGTSFVLVFGNPGGPDFVPPRPAGADSGSGEAQSAAAGPPSFVVGQDQYGNIMHQIQPDDTLGQIALIYGYTWSDIPAMLALNGMTEADYRNLKIGDVFLVPPQAGTYTPTPGDPPTATPPAQTDIPTTTALPSVTPAPAESPTATSTQPPVVLANSVPDTALLLLPSLTPTVVMSATPPPTQAGTVIALAVTPILLNTPSGQIITSSGTSPWLIIGLVVQVGVLLLAGAEFLRRARRRAR
ncbi:MAG: hypothetical protein JNJ61_06495 [Anaerolineae bacterium]|nr:hypothetical protein [Anaerolineae bacterium]